MHRSPEPQNVCTEKAPFEMGKENESVQFFQRSSIVRQRTRCLCLCIPKKAELEEGGFDVKIQKNQKAVYRVYCHELEPTAWSKSAFKKQQSASVRALAHQHAGPIYYVGQTELSPSVERARNHVNPDHKHSTKWGEHHFKGRQSKDELKRWHLESLKQVQRFHESSGCPVEDLTYGQALLTEAKFAQWLKNEGYPAYFAC